jgi:hypothetical protein
VSSNVVKFKFEGLTGAMASFFDEDTWQYTISGNAMTVVSAGNTDVWNRIVNTTVANTPNSNATITLTYPKGGETWHVGDTVTITWTSTLLSKNTLIDINISPTTDQGTVQNIAEGISNTGSYQWTVPNSLAGDSLIGVKNRIFVSCEVLTSSSLQINAISPDFTIVSSSNPTTASNSNPTITVTYPKGGEIFHVGQVITITWNTTNLSNNAIVTINCNYPDGAGIYASSLEGVPNNGSFKWTIPSDITLNGGKARITIANDSGQYLVAEGSSGFFTVTN